MHSRFSKFSKKTFGYAQFLMLSCCMLMLISQSLKGQVKLGIDVLETSGFKCLKNKRVGLLTHPAGVNAQGKTTIDILWNSPQVNLTALYGPEHGIYGDEKANVKIQNRLDKKTKLPVYSLYGDHRRPSAEMLKNIDVMVIDLQDIGVRSYTYVSCMCYTMEECFTHNIEVVVLDRPNPLGGLKVDGPLMDQKWKSYVGALPVPYVHGLTIGELARICKMESNWLNIPKEAREKGKLTVVPMRQWERWMIWPHTQLKWTPTSPAIKDFNAVLGYPMTGLGCQLGGFVHGYGTLYPFRLLSPPRKGIPALEKALQEKNLPGIAFRRLGSMKKGTEERQEGLYISITDFDAWRPTELSFHLMQLACDWCFKNPFIHEKKSNLSLFNKHVGSEEWYKALTEQGGKVDVGHFIAKWTQDSKKFQEWSKQYWLY